MSIIKTLQDYLTEFDGMEMILTDLTPNTPSSYALAPAGSGVASKDVLGNVTYQNSYVFLAREHSSDEVDRRDNYDFLEAFCDWLKERSRREDFPALPKPYQVVEIGVSNVMLMDIDDNGLGTYQIQIQLIFERRYDT